MTAERFGELVTEGVAALPDWVREELVNVAFLVSDEPSRATRKENGLEAGENLFGLYEGVPLSERGNEPVMYPDTITLFRKPIMEAYERDEDIRACIHNTIWHEVAHYFGHGEEWVEQEEIRRNKLL